MDKSSMSPHLGLQVDKSNAQRWRPFVPTSFAQVNALDEANVITIPYRPDATVLMKQTLPQPAVKTHQHHPRHHLHHPAVFQPAVLLYQVRY
jgi:hypothetical protein